MVLKVGLGAAAARPPQAQQARATQMEPAGGSSLPLGHRRLRVVVVVLHLVPLLQMAHKRVAAQTEHPVVVRKHELLLSSTRTVARGRLARLEVLKPSDNIPTAVVQIVVLPLENLLLDLRQLLVQHLLLLQRRVQLLLQVLVLLSTHFCPVCTT